MSFADAIETGQRQAEKRSARELRARLKRHGGPNDLGDLQALKARFADLPGAMFDRVLREFSKKGSKSPRRVSTRRY